MQNAHNNDGVWAFSIFPDSGKTQKALKRHAFDPRQGKGAALQGLSMVRALFCA
jgi:hypothetical protein